MQRNRRGLAAMTQAWALVFVSLLAAGTGLLALGQAGQRVIAKQAASQVERRSLPQLSSRQEAALGALIRNLPTAARSLVSDLIDAADEGRVLAAVQAKRAIESSEDFDLANPELRNFLADRLALSYRAAEQTIPTLDQGLLGVTRRALESDLAVARRLLEIEGDGERLFDNIQPRRELSDAEQTRLSERLPVVREARRAWVKFFLYEDLRTIMLRAIDDDARRFTDGAWEKLDTLPDAEKNVGVLTIGAGLSGSHAASVLNEIDPNIPRLVVEAGDSATSANFLSGGQAFAYNMTNRFFRLLGAQGPGVFANLAPIIGPLNPADFSGLKYAPAKTWAEAAAVSLRSSNADVMIGTRVVDVVEDTTDNAPGFWKVTLERGGQQQVVWADVVLDAVGAGRPKLIGDEATQTFIAEEFAKLDLDDPSVQPLVVSARDDLAMSSLHPEWRDTQTADELDPNLRDLVVGIGDSAFTLIENLFGLGFQLDARVNAQRGLVGGIDFVVGNDGPATAREFLLGIREEAIRAQARAGRLDDRINVDEDAWPGVRTRYADIYTAMVKAQEQLLQGRGEPADAARVEAISTTRSEIERLLRESDELGPETILLRPTRLEKLKPVEVNGRRLVEATFSDGTSKVYRRAKLATGYENPSGDWLKSVVGDVEGDVIKSGRLDKVDANGRKIGDSDTRTQAVARSIPDKPYFWIGYAAGPDLIRSENLAGVTENNAAFFNWAPLVRELLTGLVRREEIPRFGSEALRRDPPRYLLGDAGVSEGSLGLVKHGTRRELRGVLGHESLALRVELAKALSTLEDGIARPLDAPAEFRLRFFRRDGELRWSSEGPALPAEFAESLAKNRSLGVVLERLLVRGRDIGVAFALRAGADDELYGLARTFDEDSLRITQ